MLVFLVPGDLDGVSLEYQEELRSAVRVTLTSAPLNINARHIISIDLKSGSILVETTLDAMATDKLAGAQLMIAEGDMTFFVNGTNLTATMVDETGDAAPAAASSSDNTTIVIIGVVVGLVVVLFFLVVAILVAGKKQDGKVQPLEEIQQYPQEPELKEVENDIMQQGVIVEEKATVGELRGTHNEERWISRKSRANVLPSKNNNRNAWKEAETVHVAPAYDENGPDTKKADPAHAPASGQPVDSRISTGTINLDLSEGASEPATEPIAE